MSNKTIEKLTCITTNKATYNGQPLYKALLEIGKKNNVLQATAIRGLDMVSPISPPFQGNAFQRANYPILVQIFGTPEENELFLEKVTPIIQNLIIIKEQVQILSAK